MEGTKALEGVLLLSHLNDLDDGVLLFWLVPIRKVCVGCKMLLGQFLFYIFFSLCAFLLSVTSKYVFLSSSL